MEQSTASSLFTFTSNPGSLFLRSPFALPPYQSRCKVGAKSVREGSYIEFGTEEERRKDEGIVYKKDTPYGMSFCWFYSCFSFILSRYCSYVRFQRL